MLRFCSLVLFCLLPIWCALVYFVPATVFWRDSGEFLLSGFFLDITHPAGFPLFGQLSNLFALLPLGPIAWRVNCFAAFLAIICLLLSFVLSYQLLRQTFNAGKREAALFAIVPAMLLLSSPAFIKQALSAEVYVLNCVFVQLLLLLTLRFHQERDARLLVGAAFVGGLSLANHVSIALILLPAVMLILFVYRPAPRILLPSLFFGLIGLSMYGYIPVRASAHPPLNTGGADTPARFLNLVTDARDRALRPDPLSVLTQPEDSSEHSSPSNLSALAANIMGDLRKLAGETNGLMLMISALGLCILALKHPCCAALLILVAAGNWIFFKGWDPDPWMPILFAAGIGCAVALYQISRIMLSLFPAVRYAHALLLLVAAFVFFKKDSLVFANGFKEFDRPAQRAKQLLDGVPYGGTMITEHSWFILKHLRDIEGYREDVMLFYQPRLLFPAYFARTGVADSTGKTFDSHVINPSAHPDAKPETANLARLIGFAAAIAPIVVEPSQAINFYFTDVAIFASDGTVQIRKGQQAQYSPDFSAALSTQIHNIVDQQSTLVSYMRSDSLNYMENVLNSYAQLYACTDKGAEGIALYKDICFPPEKNFCSVVTLNNMAMLYLSLKQMKEGARLLLDLLKSRPENHDALIHNLRLAVRHLDAATREELLKNESDRALLLETGLIGQRKNQP